MKLVRYFDGERVSYGVLDDGAVFELKLDPFWLDGPEALALAVSGARESEPASLKDVRLLAPTLPTKIVAIGLNYKAHAAEFSLEIPEEPMLFFKPPTAIVGPADDIVYPTHISHRVDYEAELAIIVGREAKDIAVTESAEYILGYTCFNDVTARDIQGRDSQYARSKGFDTFAPIGPWIETELDTADLKVESFLNGEVKQSSTTEDMIFKCDELLSFVSCMMTLMPGDVIATGTPSGVGKMKPGDEVEVRIEGIGSLVNSISEAE
jgi:2-keto-4-pentenoate hydratase/2-oxohepta-3-ene-1,7-dioic acid hydratase in catechol pathway